jgi:dipeptidase
MCDTLVARAATTAAGRAFFAKNSDRERNEAQDLEMIPAAAHGPGAALKVTYVVIPQVARTHACLLSRPFWMWGAEMGANEHGVVIGNEAMHAHVAPSRRRALIGMDLVRLGLERAASAAEAVEVITGLLERHGQGGDCGHLGRFYYHNGFIIADAREAFVLETIGSWWAVERVERSRALSNALSIGKCYERISGGLAEHARAQGWCDRAGRFDVAERFIDLERDAVSFGRGRCARGTTRLAAADGRLTPASMMSILRDHGAEGEANPAWAPADTVGRTICMHAAEGPRRSQSVASLVSELDGAASVHWVTGTSAPCLSLFKPVQLQTGLPPQGPAPTDRYDGETLWWAHERLHRAALDDFAAALSIVAPVRDRVEASFIARVADARKAGDPVAMRTVIADCWREAAETETRWLGQITASAKTGSTAARAPSGFRRSWARLNHVAGLPRARRAEKRTAP